MHFVVRLMVFLYQKMNSDLDGCLREVASVVPMVSGRCRESEGAAVRGRKISPGSGHGVRH